MYCESTYADFIGSKRFIVPPSGFIVPPESFDERLFPFQRDIVRWALRRGKAALFEGTGLGKTIQQVTWSDKVADYTQGRVLILAPLAVAEQTVREAAKFGITVTLCRSQADVRDGVNIANYERLHLFELASFTGVALDESSILKSFNGATRNQIIDGFARTPFKLAATATPAPNDYMELGNHAEFLGVMSRAEMLAMFFTHDGGETQKWRLKGHARADFWRWVCSWAVMLRAPSDLGYENAGFDLPPLVMHQEIVDGAAPLPGMLFAVDARTLTERRAARKGSMAGRVAACAARINASHGILDSTGRYAKLAICGSQNTQSADELNITQTKPSESADLLNPDQARITANTCAITTRPIANGSPMRERPEQPSETSSGASGTPMTPNIVKSVEPHHEAATQQQSVTHGFERSSESAQVTTTRCSQGSGDDALFVGPSSATVSSDDSMLTTATTPALCADFSAPNATSDLGSSKTTLPSLSAPSATSSAPERLEPWVVWCDYNEEQSALEKAFGDRAISIHGTLSAEEKTVRLLAWLDGERPILISKPSICGFGINMQHCARIAFVGLSDSWEQYYQAIRRCWRFGQQRPVECYVYTSDVEGAIVANIERKERDAARMGEEMVREMQDLNREAITASERETDEYERRREGGERWTAYLGDCVEVVGEMADASIDYSVFSPPFASLYTYSNSPRDMGNVRTHGEFYEHFAFLVRELYRVLKAGRLLSFHCMNLPTSKARDGVIGISDFRGDLIRMFTDAGFIFHSEVCIWKDPVTAMQRTKAIGLLYKQLKKDSALSRQGIPDYLVTMRKPGDNPAPITKDPDNFPVSLWQRYASPVWMDINPSDTLQRESAREAADERHIAPLQLEVIRRAILLWTNPDDLVLSPFMGIASEGYVALEEGRRFMGAELKASYYKQAVANLRRIEATPRQVDLFAAAGMEVAD